MKDLPDFNPSAQAVRTIADWAAFEGTDKNFTAEANDKTFGTGTYVWYIVPTGKTLYITGTQASVRARLAADGDKPQMCQLSFVKTGNDVAWGGGNGGVALTFSKPIVFGAGSLLELFITSYANHTVNVYVSAQGYEVNV